VCEAHHFLDVPLDQIDVLSVGTTQVPPHLQHPSKSLSIG
jgi:hypothetical protein